MIKNLRTLAHDLIKTAVINQNGCIGTMYDHQGIRHKACSADRRYYFTPSVAVMPDKKEKQDSIGIFKIVEIFVDTQKQLYCSIQLKNGEIVEVPLDRIRIDYLNIILYWLTFNGFMTDSPTEGEKIKICK